MVVSMPATLVRPRSMAVHVSYTGTQTLLNETATHSGGQARTEASREGEGLTIVSLRLHKQQRGMEAAHKAGVQCCNDMPETYYEYCGSQADGHGDYDEGRPLKVSTEDDSSERRPKITPDKIRWALVVVPAFRLVVVSLKMQLTLMGKASPWGPRSQTAWRDPKAEPQQVLEKKQKKTQPWFCFFFCLVFIFFYFFFFKSQGYIVSVS